MGSNIAAINMDGGGMRHTILIAMAAVACSTALAQKPPAVDEAALRAAMDGSLKDAASARFRAIQHLPTEKPGVWNVCGQVNAKNGYGGYAGYSPFLAVVGQPKGKPASYVLIGIGPIAEQLCAAQ